MTSLRLIAVALLACAATAPARADIVKCVADGRVSYQETPCEEGRMKAVDTRPTSKGYVRPPKGSRYQVAAAYNAGGPGPATIPVPQSTLPTRSIARDNHTRAVAGTYR